MLLGSCHWEWWPVSLFSWKFIHGCQFYLQGEPGAPGKAGKSGIAGNKVGFWKKYFNLINIFLVEKI